MRNKYRKRGDKIIILLGRKTGEYLETVVSKQDFRRISKLQGKWYADYNARCNSLYVKNSKRVKGKTVITQLHTHIMDPFKPDIPNIEIDHINGDALDNTRENLRWVTKAENNEKREHRIGRDRDGKWIVRGINEVYETRSEAIAARDQAELSEGLI